LCDCVAQLPVPTLDSRSSTVRLLRMKNLSFCETVSAGRLILGSATAAAAAAAGTPPARPSPGWSWLLSGYDGCCAVDAAGPVGAVNPDAPSTALLRSRLTSRTDWNLESCSFCCAATQLCSSLKFAKAQLLLEMRKRDSRPAASVHTWWTRFIRSVWGGKFPIQIACPVRLR